MTFSRWMTFTHANRRREDGQTMAEYGVILAVITIGSVTVSAALSGTIVATIDRIVGYLPS